MQISRLIQSRVRELFILETSTTLRQGQLYRISFFQYRGVIGDDLRGLYRSKYRDNLGRLRYASRIVELEAIVSSYRAPAMVVSVVGGTILVARRTYNRKVVGSSVRGLLT